MTVARFFLVFTAVFCLAFASCASGRNAPDVEPETAEDHPASGPVVKTIDDVIAADEEEQAEEFEKTYVAGLMDEDEGWDHHLLPGEEFSVAPHDLLSEVDPDLSAETVKTERQRWREGQPEFDFPVVTNQKVEFWIDYYTRRNPETFAKGLARSGRYMQMFRDIFAEAGVPRDMVYFAHVESAYKTNAYSRARAKGVFQFISATGRRYGLRIDYWVDERSDPEKSARASAAYLRDLYDEFGDWYLALAAYNGGEGRVRRAIRRSGTKDFWKISASTRHLRRETRNYVPAILAATMISKDPAKYGFDVTYDDPIHYETIEVEGAADLRVLAKCAGSDFDTLRLLNPMLRRYQTPPGATTQVRVPVGTADRTLAALADVPQNQRVLYARHHVRQGDTLSKLARQYGVSVRAIQDTNRMGRSTMIRVGRTLIIPTVATQDYPGATASGAVDAVSGEVVTYRVRRGDTLTRIARRYGTSANAIASASGIGLHSTLSIGQRLRVVPGVRSSSEASRIARGGGGGGGDSASTGTIHTVRRGESLWRIANRYKTTVAAICSLNGISANAVLHPGTKLQIR